jgi:NADP-dependent 3-hydroxy acid dehydrogenase YdfG
VSLDNSKIAWIIGASSGIGAARALLSMFQTDSGAPAALATIRHTFTDALSL